MHQTEVTNHVNVLQLHPPISNTITSAINYITDTTEEEDIYEDHDDNDKHGEETNSRNSLTKLIVAVELTQLFRPDLLSDLVYLLSDVHQSPSVTTCIHKTQTTSLATLFGIPYSNASHDALDVGCMDMLLTTIVPSR